MANTRIGHRLVEFGTEGCHHCGNERLRHLHRIRLDDGSVIEVGCVCAMKLCPAEAEGIACAERQMDKESDRLKKVAALRASWTLRKSKGVVRSVTGSFNDKELTIYWELGQGYTINLPNAPVITQKRGGYEEIQRWVEHYFAADMKVSGV